MKVSALYFLFLLKAGRMFVLYNLSIVWYNQRKNYTNFQVTFENPVCVEKTA